MDYYYQQSEPCNNVTVNTEYRPPSWIYEGTRSNIPEASTTTLGLVQLAGTLTPSSNLVVPSYLVYGLSNNLYVAQSNAAAVDRAAQAALSNWVAGSISGQWSFSSNNLCTSCNVRVSGVVGMRSLLISRSI